jgi:hypothetical protein
MLRFLLLFFTTILLAQSPKYDELKARVYNFEKHYDVFFRKLYGCPALGEISKLTCDATRSVIDNGNFQSARDKAKVLFDF